MELFGTTRKPPVHGSGGLILRRANLSGSLVLECRLAVIPDTEEPFQFALLHAVENLQQKRHARKRVLLVEGYEWGQLTINQRIKTDVENASLEGSPRLSGPSVRLEEVCAMETHSRS
jgi:hypothetical protein